MTTSTPTASRTLTTHLPALDGVRGLAILLVIACHTSAHLAMQSDWNTPTGRYAYLYLGAGWVGVDLFFVLSGFLITRILLASKGSTHFFRSFYARRALRILPLYLAFCGLLFIQTVRHHVPGDKGDLLSLVLYYNNVRAAFFGWHTGLAFQCWSLAVEEHFYLVWPLVIAFTPPRYLRNICLYGIALSLIARLVAMEYGLPVQAVYILTPCRLDGLLMGALLADLFAQPAAWARVRRYALPAMAVAAVGLGLIALFQGHLFSDVAQDHPMGLRHSSRLVLGPGLLLLAIFFGGFLVQSTSGGRLSRTMQWAWLRSLGKYSYGIYLFHVGIMIVCRKAIVHHAPELVRDWRLEPFFLVMVLFATYACAWISYHLYEQRFLALKRLFPTRIAASTSRTPPMPANSAK